MKSLISALLVLVCFQSFAQGSNMDTRTTAVLKYVQDHGPLTSCKQPSSKVMSFCGISHSVPSFLVDYYRLYWDYFIPIMNNTGQSFCLHYTKRILCGGLLPKCSSDSTTLTYPDMTQACQAASPCSVNPFSTSGWITKLYCPLSGTTMPLNSCVNPSITTLSTQYCGLLPNVNIPTWADTELRTQAQYIRFIKLAHPLAGVSTNCTYQWRQMLCNSITSCNAANNRIITSGVSRQQCHAAINCLPDSVRNYGFVHFDCDLFANGASSVSSYMRLIAAISLLMVIINF